MRRSTKAALLSGLVFPGLGHIYLRRYVQGILLALGAGLALYVIVSAAVHTALDVAEKIAAGGVPLDVEVISDLVSEQSRDTGQSTRIATIALFAFWAVGIADSYRAGRARERARGGTREKKA